MTTQEEVDAAYWMMRLSKEVLREALVRSNLVDKVSIEIVSSLVSKYIRKFDFSYFHRSREFSHGLIQVSQVIHDEDLKTSLVEEFSEGLSELLTERFLEFCLRKGVDRLLADPKDRIAPVRNFLYVSWDEFGRTVFSWSERADCVVMRCALMFSESSILEVR